MLAFFKFCAAFADSMPSLNVSLLHLQGVAATGAVMRTVATARVPVVGVRGGTGAGRGAMDRAPEGTVATAIALVGTASCIGRQAGVGFCRIGF